MKYACLALILAMAAAPALAEPFYVDLSKAANRSLQDDPVGGNGEGGWSDEGANDMFVHPPIEFGEVTRNGYHFKLAKPTEGDPETVIMLQGEALTDLPKDVTVSVPDVKGKYVYFLQNLVRMPGGIDGKQVAEYTLHYADGSKATMSLEGGKHLRHWWTGNWYDNSGADSWPFFMGVNAYSIKWKQHVGVWAMRWQNPHPDKAISGITLASEGKASPAIFAITIDDEDYNASDQLKADYKRLPGVPTGYFDEKMAAEARRIFQVMIEQGIAKGVRQIELIRPDMLAITLDAAVTGGPGAGEEKAASLQSPENFSITVGGGAAVQPQKVGRFSYEYWNGNIGPFPQNIVYWHTYYLQLDKPLSPGEQCSVKVAGLDEPFQDSVSLTFDPAKTETRVIKVNQVAYSGQAKRRYAYLGWWAGDLGAVNYDAFKTFRVIDETTGESVLDGQLAVRAEDDPLSGERVYEMDLSPLGQGRYHIVVDGLGRSSSFGVGGEGIDELYKQTNRAYYHQRAATALTEPYTTFTTPIHRHRITRSGRVAADDDKGTADDPIKTFHGGYHDAADYDVFTYHLRATAQTLGAYEMYPKTFGDGDFNIPESGNGVPDVLDEADWALKAYLELQLDSGAVPLGRGNEQDAQRDYVAQHGKNPPYAIFPPTTTSTAEYAAVAAQYARLIKPYNADRAKQYLASAKKAFEWAHANQNVGGTAERAGKLMLTWAASELVCTTGNEKIGDVFEALYRDGGFSKYHWSYGSYVATFMRSYAFCDGKNVNEEIRKELRDRLVKEGKYCLGEMEKPAYRMGLGAKDRSFGWGSANGGGRYAEKLLLAYAITGEQGYLDGASLNADFQLGCNPLSKTFITSMGARPPRHPQIHAYLYTGPNKTGMTVKGITVYGLAGYQPSWYPSPTPPWRRWRDIGNGGAEISSEFTITETIGASSMLYSTLHALQMKK